MAMTDRALAALTEALRAERDIAFARCASAEAALIRERAAMADLARKAAAWDQIHDAIDAGYSKLAVGRLAVAILHHPNLAAALTAASSEDTPLSPITPVATEEYIDLARKAAAWDDREARLAEVLRSRRWMLVDVVKMRDRDGFPEPTDALYASIAHAIAAALTAASPEDEG